MTIEISARDQHVFMQFIYARARPH